MQKDVIASVSWLYRFSDSSQKAKQKQSLGIWMQKRFLSSPLIAVLVIGVSIATYVYLNATKPQVPLEQEEEKAWPVAASEVVYGKHQPQLVLLGYVESPSDSQMTAAVEGNVVNIAVSEGLLVEKGQLLVELDSAESMMSLALREGEVEDLAAQIEMENNSHQAALEAIGRERKLLNLSQAAVEREKLLFQKKLGSESRLDQSRMTLEQQALAVNAQKLHITNHESRLSQLQAKLKRAKSLLDRARLDLERTNIRAPFSGRISKLHVAIGERVNPGTSVIDLYAADQLEVRALIPERYLATVTRGMDSHIPVTATTTYLGGALTLTLDRLAGVVDQARGGVDGIFVLEERNSTLPLGKPLQVVLDLPAIANTIGIPLKALFSDRSVYEILDGRLQVVNIRKLGEAFSAEGEPIVIAESEELQPGDLYLMTRLPNPVTGLKVAVVQVEAIVKP